MCRRPPGSTWMTGFPGKEQQSLSLIHICVMPSGRNVFRDQFERVLPASSVANLYPFNYSGKTDPHGFYVGRDKFGSNILVDFNQRADDKTNGSILILGNSGQGKSYLLKLLDVYKRQYVDR